MKEYRDYPIQDYNTSSEPPSKGIPEQESTQGWNINLSAVSANVSPNSQK